MQKLDQIFRTSQLMGLYIPMKNLFFSQKVKLKAVLNEHNFENIFVQTCTDPSFSELCLLVFPMLTNKRYHLGIICLQIRKFVSNTP